MNNIHTEIEKVLTQYMQVSPLTDCCDAPLRLNEKTAWVCSKCKKPCGGAINNHSVQSINKQEATKALEALLLDAQAEGYKRGYIAGKQALVNLGADRLKEDEYYTLQAFIEDCQEYLDRLNQLNKENKE